MSQTNIEFCRNLFEKLINADDKADEFIVLDYFSLKTIQLLEDYDGNEVWKYTDLFRDFEERCSRIRKLKRYEVFFFSLMSLLENKYYYFLNDDESERMENIKNYVNHLKSIIEK